MFLQLKRMLAVGIAASVAFVGFSATAPVAQAAPTTSAVSKASKWLVAHPATADDGYGGLITSTLGLAVLDTKGGAATVRKQVAALSAGASANVPGNAGRAANLAILARIMHLSARNFGGVNLVTTLQSTIAADGQVGSFGSAYAQALTIIALKRTSTAVPANVVAKLLSFQDASGAFGYEYPAGTFNPDPDSTALAMQALNLTGGHKAAITKAVRWAKKNQAQAGYWVAYSPVDTTSLMATALKQVGRGSVKARTWLLGQQLGDGGFAAELRTSTSTSNLTATANASFLLRGVSLAKASYKLKGYGASPRPWITGTKRVGSTLTAHTGTWSPKPQLAYQWLRNGHRIAGATAGTYVLTGADAGTHIRVKVTASGIGLKERIEVSKRTRLVRR